MSRIRSWKVSAKESGEKLVTFLKKKLKDAYSSRAIKRAIEDNGCTVNRCVERFASTVVREGDIIELELDLLKTGPKQHLKFERSRILYESEELIAYNKPAGIPSEGLDSVETLVQTYCRKASLVHRLDKETSGVLLLAKTSQSRQAMLNLFRKREVEKTYLAIVDGVPKKNRGIIKNFLGKIHTYEGQAIWGRVAKEKGKYACTFWNLEKKGKGACLLRCVPKTGRTHQVRAHLKEMNHPILGDYQYCRTFLCSYRPKRCLLHAWAISFRQPSKEEEVRIQAPLPPDFRAAFKALQLMGR